MLNLPQLHLKRSNKLLLHLGLFTWSTRPQENVFLSFFHGRKLNLGIPGETCERFFKSMIRKKTMSPSADVQSDLVGQMIISEAGNPSWWDHLQDAPK